jgi:hypothetical protein
MYVLLYTTKVLTIRHGPNRKSRCLRPGESSRSNRLHLIQSQKADPLFKNKRTMAIFFQFLQDDISLTKKERRTQYFIELCQHPKEKDPVFHRILSASQTKRKVRAKCTTTVIYIVCFCDLSRYYSDFSGCTTIIS